MIKITHFCFHEVLPQPFIFLKILLKETFWFTSNQETVIFHINSLIVLTQFPIMSAASSQNTHIDFFKIKYNSFKKDKTLYGEGSHPVTYFRL